MLICAAILLTWTQLATIELKLLHAGSWYFETIWITSAGVDFSVGRNFSRDERPDGFKIEPSPSLGFDAYESAFGQYRKAPGLFVFTSRNSEYEHVSVVLSLWLVTVLTALLPLIWLAHRIVISRGIAPNKCRFCGYDLRMTQDRCPECGTICATDART